MSAKAFRYVSIFSGIEAATVAFQPFGWDPLAFSEIAPFPSAVLQTRFPNVPNLGDITNVDWGSYKDVDLVVGGSPCFPAGTMILTDMGSKPIETIRPGDMVRTHKGNWKPVLKTGSTRSDTILLTSETGRRIECTPNHPFLAAYMRNGSLTSDGWREARYMYDRYWHVNASDKWEHVTGQQLGRTGITVHNLEVQDDHTYVANGIDVHNCQSFSVAGKREGLHGVSGLMFEYIRSIREIRPRWLLWENVPGALSSEHGAAFRQLLASLDELGYGLAWRILDAQYFGVPQRRRRIFLVGHLGDQRACEVLFERESLQRDPAPGRTARKEAAGTVGPGVARADRSTGKSGVISFIPETGTSSRSLGYEERTAPTLRAGGSNHVPAVLSEHDPEEVACFVPNASITASTIGWSETTSPTLRASTHVPAVQFRHPLMCRAGLQTNSETLQDLAPTMSARQYKDPPIIYPVAAVEGNQRGESRLSGGDGKVMGCLSANRSAKQYQAITDGVTIRRLTPLECERLQGFPDGWTDIPYRNKAHAADGPRYMALGNSMAVPVMRWLGGRIRRFDSF